jgi:hypothetical protein
MKDLHSFLNPLAAIEPVKVLDATVPSTVELDLQGYNSAAIVIHWGAKGAGDTGTIDVTMTHADDDGTGASGSYANVAAADVEGVTPATGVVKNLAAGAVATGILLFSYVGGKRFIKLAVTETNANATGTIMDIIVLRGHPENTVE